LLRQLRKKKEKSRFGSESLPRFNIEVFNFSGIMAPMGEDGPIKMNLF